MAGGVAGVWFNRNNDTPAVGGGETKDVNAPARYVRYFAFVVMRFVIYTRDAWVRADVATAASSRYRSRFAS